MNKYLATFEYNKFMNDILDAKITAKKFVNEKNISKKKKKKKKKKIATKTEFKAE